MFVNVNNDGYKLDTRHDTPIDADDLPFARIAYRNRQEYFERWCSRNTELNWEEDWWFADYSEIVANDYNLTTSHYRPFNCSNVHYEDPIKLVDEVIKIEMQLLDELKILRVYLDS